MTDERTNEQISAEIAGRLFGQTVEWREWDWKEDGETGHTAAFVVVTEGVPFWHIVDPYASDHNAAMGLVVSEMRKRGWSFEMGDCLDETSVECSFDFIPRTAPFGQEPRAICLAALAALDAEEAQG